MKPATYPTPRVVEWQNAIKAAELAVERAIELTQGVEVRGKSGIYTSLADVRAHIRIAHRKALEATK